MNLRSNETKERKDSFLSHLLAGPINLCLFDAAQTYRRTCQHLSTGTLDYTKFLSDPDGYFTFFNYFVELVLL